MTEAAVVQATTSQAKTSFNRSSTLRKNQKKNLKRVLFVSSLSLIGSLLLFSSFAAQAEIGDAFVLCKHEKSVRTLRIEGQAENSCKAIYTKQGVDQVIGASQNGGSCEEYINGVKKTLETAHWNCREVKESRVSNLSSDDRP